MASKKTDSLSRRGAFDLAAKICAYWKQRGFAVQVTTYELPGFPEVFGVRSNLSSFPGGLPA